MIMPDSIALDPRAYIDHENGYQTTTAAALLPSARRHESVNPRSDQSLLDQAREHYLPPAKISDLNWSGIFEAHQLRHWKWNRYRVVATDEPPLLMEYLPDRQPTINYVKAEDILGYMQGEKDTGSFRIALSYMKGDHRHAPFVPLLGTNIIQDLLMLFNMKELRDSYPARVLPTFWSKSSTDSDTWGQSAIRLYIYMHLIY